MHSRRNALLLLVVLTTAVASTAEENGQSEPFVEKEFVIVKSTPSVKKAAEAAESAAERLGVLLDLRGLSRHERTGLIFSEDECSRRAKDARR
jgi:hypothetical protein